MNEKGLLSVEELDERKKQVAGRLVRIQNATNTLSSMKLRLTARAGGIYAKQYAASFLLPLSRQDVEESVIRWEFGRPYLIAYGEDGYCMHTDKESYMCTVC